MIFKIGMNSLEVFQTIVSNHKEIFSIRIIEHPAGKNWRELNEKANAKLNSLDERFDIKPAIQEINLKREDFLKLTFDKLLKLRKFENNVLSIHGTIKLDNGKEGFIPMMNFHLEKNVDLKFIKKTLEIMGEKDGVILDSGRYFHYYANRIVNHNDWLKFIGCMLLPTIIVTEGYIGYSLIRGTTLRLTSNNVKTKIPSVIKII